MSGGVAQKAQVAVRRRIFRAAHSSHPPYQELLAAIPTSLMVCAEPGLIGCAALAERLMGGEARKARAARGAG
jgi:glucokinase